MLAPWKKNYDQPTQHIIKQRHYFANKGPFSQSFGFPEVMCGCESWTIEKLSTEELMLLNCGVGEDSWKSLGQQGNPSRPSQRKSSMNIHWKDWFWSWNSNILAPDAKNWLIWKDLNDGKDWSLQDKRTTEEEMVGWHHRLDGHEF